MSPLHWHARYFIYDIIHDSKYTKIQKPFQVSALFNIIPYEWVAFNHNIWCNSLLYCFNASLRISALLVLVKLYKNYQFVGSRLLSQGNFTHTRLHLNDVSKILHTHQETVSRSLHLCVTHTVIHAFRSHWSLTQCHTSYSH